MHIAIAVDLSLESHAAVSWGLSLRKRLRQRGLSAPLSIVSVIAQAAPFHHHSLPGYDSDLSDRGARHRLAHQLREFIATAGRPTDDVRIVLREGNPTDQLAAFCREQYADLLICGATSVQGLSRLIVGSTAHQLLDTLDCPLVVAHPQHLQWPAQPQWVVGVDFDTTSEQTLWEAARMADLSAARLHLVHALDSARASTGVSLSAGSSASSRFSSSSELAARTAEMRQSLQSMMAEVSTRFPALQYATFVHPAPPAPLLNEYVQKRDAHAAFVGTRTRGRLERLIYPSVDRNLLKRFPTTMIFVPSR